MVTFHYFPTVLVSPTGLTEIPTQQVLYWHMYSAIHLAVKKNAKWYYKIWKTVFPCINLRRNWMLVLCATVYCGYLRILFWVFNRLFLCVLPLEILLSFNQVGIVKVLLAGKHRHIVMSVPNPGSRFSAIYMSWYYLCLMIWGKRWLFVLLILVELLTITV
jgi:hypothetical protein